MVSPSFFSEALRLYNKGVLFLYRQKPKKISVCVMKERKYVIYGTE